MKNLGLALLSLAGVAGTMQLQNNQSDVDSGFVELGSQESSGVKGTDASGRRGYSMSPESPEPGVPREFDVSLIQIIPDGGALATGGFYKRDEAPKTYMNPLDERPGIDRPLPSRGYAYAGDMFISGLETGYVDGQKWKGWLMRDGVKTYKSARGVYHTVPAFKVAPSPEARPAKPGEWMWKH